MSGSGPIYEYQRELTARLEQVMRERDEARAEIERLRAQEKRLKTLYLDARADGWRDGARAMRAQASGCAAERARYWAETSASEGGVPTLDDRAEEARYIAEDIRGLLMPEDAQ